ncbi:MAG: relaxase/mobilization nuclease domain-containing protein [Coprococcus sp.]
MGVVYGNVKVNYGYCKSVAQLKSADDYILGRRKEQIADGVVKTQNHLYNAFGCNRDNFSNSILMTRKMHDKKYSRYKQKEILAQKLSISFHPDDNDKLTYEDAYRIAEEFAREFFWSKGYEVLFAVHTDTEHVHVHFLVSNCNLRDGKSFRRGPAELKEMCSFFGEQCRKHGLTHSYRDTYYVKDKSRERCNFAEYQMKKRQKLSFREEMKIYLRNAINTPETRTLEDVIRYVKKYFMMDVKLRGNTISYALPYRRKKNGEPVSVRGKRLGERFTVSGITEYLEQKKKKRIEYQRIEADIEHMKGFLHDYDEWEKEPEEKSLEDNNISFYEGFDQFCEKEDIREADEDIFYGAAFEEFNREWQGEEDDKETSFTDKEEKEEQPDYKNISLAERVAILPEPTEDVMEELRMYEKRMGYDKDTMRSMRYKMSVYDEFLEEYEARKKKWKIDDNRNFEKVKDRICR